MTGLLRSLRRWIAAGNAGAEACPGSSSATHLHRIPVLTRFPAGVAPGNVERPYHRGLIPSCSQAVGLTRWRFLLESSYGKRLLIDRTCAVEMCRSTERTSTPHECSVHWSTLQLSTEGRKHAAVRSWPPAAARSYRRLRRGCGERYQQRRLVTFRGSFPGFCARCGRDFADDGFRAVGGTADHESGL